MKTSFKKALLGLLLFLLIILGIEGYLYLKYFEKADSGRKIKTTADTESPQEEQKVSLNRKEDLDLFQACLKGENIDIPGFLIEGKMVKLDLENKAVEVLCGENKVPTLFFTDSTKYQLIHKQESQGNKGLEIDPIRHPNPKEETSLSFSSKIEADDELQINIYEKESSYYVNTITKFTD